MSLTRQVHLRLPVEVAIKYELQAIKMGMSLPKYLIHILSSNESDFRNVKIDEIHKMMGDLHQDYFET